MASPRTNFEAPSIEPKKEDSSSSALRRTLAVSWSIRPAERSASIAICLPGMASRVKRAATSAIRPEPLVMTTKFTMIRIVKTITPITKLPLITKPAKASMTWPAAAVPSWPWARIRRVEARFSASRNIVTISSTVGKAENSSGSSMKSAVISTSTDTMIDSASIRSSRIAGIGKTSTTRMPMTPMARNRSGRLNSLPSAPRSGTTNPLPCPAVTSVIDRSAPRPLPVHDRRAPKQGAARQFLPGPW